MPPRKPSSATLPKGSEAPPARMTRSASAASNRAASSTVTKRTAGKRASESRRKVVESDSGEDEPLIEPYRDHLSASMRGEESDEEEQPPKTLRKRAGTARQSKARTSPRSLASRGRPASFRGAAGDSLAKLKATDDFSETPLVSAAMKRSPLSNGPVNSGSGRSRSRQIVEEDEPEACSVGDSDHSSQVKDTFFVSSANLKQQSEKSLISSSASQASEAAPTEARDPDSSDFLDADATFVAPSKVSRTSNDNELAASASKHARFSLPSPEKVSPPSTPSTKAGSASLGMQLSTPGPGVKTSNRLVIHKIVLRDFKSYAGVQTIGPFHKSFSSVVGPNGSGKSNVIDSLLFVFGWRANKMRQGKLSELIHSSSTAGRVKPNETKVSVVFREIEDLPGPDAYRVVPNSKLVVSRTAFQNNTSVYHLNGKRSTFTEVTNLLRGRGIDLDHKRFLILQGEVESIAQMPPKARNEHEEGLLEYLEDIIGTSRFKDEIEAAAKKFDELNEHRGERLGRLKIVQREKDAMESKKREAESLLRDQNSLTQCQSMLWQVHRWECQTAIQTARNAMEALKQKITHEHEKHNDAQASVADIELRYRTAKKEWEDMRKEVEKLIKETEGYEKEDLQREEKRKHLETKRKKLSKAMSEDKHHLSEARVTLQASEEDIERLRYEIVKLEASLETEEAALDSIRDSLKSKTGHLSEQVDAKQRDLAPWVDKIKQKEGVRDVEAQEIRLIKDREGAREKEMSDAREKRQQLKDDIHAKQRELEGLGLEKEQVGESIAQSVEALKLAKVQELDLRARLSTARAKADDAKIAQQATASQSSVLTSLTRQAELGMIKGFHGRLGSLGVIDDKYDVAISTACPGLDSIVVDTVECGQICIEHLRKNNLGRANFILLDSIVNLIVQPIDTPEGVPRLVDLVRPREARFIPAFYHQLRDTLVARDLVHANRIAYGAKRWRVVTLDGQLIDKSGTMSGGGTRIARGGMSSKFGDLEYTPEQIKWLQQDVNKLDGELQGMTMKVQHMEVELGDLSARPAQIEIEIEKLQMAIKVGTQRLEEAHMRVQELKAQNKPDAADASRLEELTSEVANLESEIGRLQETTQKFESDIAALQEKILDAGGVSLQTQQSKVQGMRSMIDVSGEELTKAEVAKARAEKDIVKYESSTSKRELAFADLEEEFQILQMNAHEKDGVASKARADLEEKQHALEGRQEERDSLKEALDESSNMINAFRSLELEIKQKFDDHQRSVRDNEGRVRHWADKIAGLELHYIDGEEDGNYKKGMRPDTSVLNQNNQARDADGNGSDEGDEVAGSDATTNARGESEVQQGQDGEESDNLSKPDNGARDLVKSFGVTELRELTAEELATLCKEDIKAEMAEYEERVSKGSGNFEILAEYRKREQEFLARAKDLDETTQARDAVKNQYEVLRRQRLDEFMAGFGIISFKLKEMYQTITLGGNAELELVDSLDPFSEGILFSVMPPKKSWKNISNLSGGEKTLSSLALVFALHAFKPTPLYVMDEIDAALDFRNVSIVANLIKERTKNAQFVIISLRNNMFELASRLVGIYKTNGQTKSLAVENTELSQAMAEEAALASATLAASARKAEAHPNPPKTPSSTVAHAQRPQASTSRQGPLSALRGNNNSLPATPSGTLRKTQMNASIPISMSMPSVAVRADHGLPKTPFAIPQTPRMPKSILTRTPRVSSAAPQIPHNVLQSSTSSSASSTAAEL